MFQAARLVSSRINKIHTINRFVIVFDKSLVNYLFAFHARLVWLYANYAEKKVFLKQVGSHSSGLNGFKTQKNVKLIGKHGDCIEMLYNKHRYRIEFNPPPEEEKLEVTSSKKRIHESNSENEGEVDLEGEERKKRSKLRDESAKTLKENEVINSGKKMEKTENSVLSGESKPTEEQLWEDVNKQLLIYTSKGVTGRTKVSRKFGA